MVSRSRVLLLVGCLAAPACIGGPTSDWPKGAEAPGNGGPGGLDAGKKPPMRDAGGSTPVIADAPSCARDEDAGIPLDAGDAPGLDASLPEAGCR